jgi:mycoredoxin
MGVALIGFFGPWIPHRAVALIVTGFELSEFAKFFPEVQTGAVRVIRSLFLLPLPSLSLLLGLWVNASTRRLRGRRIGTILAALLALLALPPYEALRAPDYRAQLLLAAGGSLLALLTTLSRRWPPTARAGLAAASAVAGLTGPLTQFSRLHPLVEVLYNKPVGTGWGLVACALGFSVSAAWYIRLAAVRHGRPRVSVDRSELLTRGDNVDDNQGILLYGTAWCSDSRNARHVLDELRVNYRFVDIDKDPTGAAYVKQVNRGFRSVPTIVFPDGSILVEPSSAQLRDKLSSGS